MNERQREAMRALRAAENPRLRFSSGAGKAGYNADHCDKIIGETATTFGIKKTELIGKSRIRRFVTPRWVAMYLMQDILGMSTTQIGVEISGRDHTTVGHGIAGIRRRLRSGEFELDYKISSIRRRLASAGIGEKPVKAFLQKEGFGDED